MQRRAFVKSGALALVTMGLSPSFLRRTAFAQELTHGAARLAGRGKVLVCLFQRGAADALNVVVPFGDRAYYALRPNIAVPEPGRPNGALDLDGFYALHPALAPLKPLWDRGLLAPIHAVGSPSATRSHFDAQDYMETATPDVKGTKDGWLNRYLALRGTCESGCAHGAAASPFRAVSMTPQTPRVLDGPAPVVAMNSLAEFSIRAAGGDAEQRLEALYTTGSADLVHGAGADTFEAMKVLRAANPQQYRPQHDAQYPNSPFGQRLRQIAQLIRAGVGLEVAFADVGGWDTHVNQGGATGQLANRLGDFARSIAAFTTDLGDRMEDVVILTMSEFGRTARQNGTGGTDHGHAGSMFVIGGGVKGGRVHGRWPGLAPEQLNEGRDLALTTDFRAVFAEVARTHLGAERLDRLFPGYEATALPGVLG
ncbi:DUF1501 domain-containing protein [Roseisolibacter sp. H3M3-2]|uniref:DUF1501 domain-containing protein n=1 Tax=Roseisolibacter sp. H3M3-2 TaxID=3031323 RepID=UPI0023DC183E|nr:DUF1501 domain-containing protein [Roseisolibacter sp. H3M3-2]MDF1505861.1 DUF1501 domain-containing protein [Roseisolibacter sp. H3M3-2]